MKTSIALALSLSFAALLAPGLALAYTYTYDNGSNYSSYPSGYPYNYTNNNNYVQAPYLTCSSVYPTVSLGNAGRFTVISNEPGPFEWVAPEFGVVNAGTVFTTPFNQLGQQQVSVVYGSVRATCYVNVVAQGGYGEPYAYESYSPYSNSGYSYGSYGTAPNVSLTSYGYPTLPNTGFEPQNMAAFAFAVVLLLAAGIALYPHVRKAFAIVGR